METTIARDKARQFVEKLRSGEIKKNKLPNSSAKYNGEIEEKDLVSYTAYWILRNKPLQVNSNYSEPYVNEKFVISLIFPELFDNEKFYVDQLPVKSKEIYSDLIKRFMYYFRYRQYNAQVIEFMIENFKAGLNFFGEVNKV